MLREMTSPAFAPSFKRFAQCTVVGLALAGLAACGGGGSSTPAETAPTTPTPDPDPTPSTPPEIPITRAPEDHPDTLEAAVVVAAGATVEGSIGSPDDVDFFKVQLTGPNTVTFWTTGEADTAIGLLDGEGADLSSTVSEGRVSRTTAMAEVFARVSGRQGGSTGDYNLLNEVASPEPLLACRRSVGNAERRGLAGAYCVEFFSEDALMGSEHVLLTRRPDGTFGCTNPLKQLSQQELQRCPGSNREHREALGSRFYSEYSVIYDCSVTIVNSGGYDYYRTRSFTYDDEYDVNNPSVPDIEFLRAICERGAGVFTLHHCSRC